MSDFYLDDTDNETVIENSSIIEELTCQIDSDIEAEFKDALVQYLVHKEQNVNKSESKYLPEPEYPPAELDVDVEIDGELKGIWDALDLEEKDDDVLSLYSMRALDVNVEIDGRLKGIWNSSTNLPLNDEVFIYSIRALDVDVEVDANLKGIWGDIVNNEDYCPPMDVDVEIDGPLKGIW